MGQLFRWCEILVLDVQKGICCPVSDASHVQTASEVVCMFCFAEKDERMHLTLSKSVSS